MIAVSQYTKASEYFLSHSLVKPTLRKIKYKLILWEQYTFDSTALFLHLP